MKKKVIILGTIAIGVIITATVIPIVLFANKEEKIEKDNVIYANKLKALKTKIVTINATSGDVTTNKNAILNKIKLLSNFPKLPKVIILDIKNSNEKLTIKGIPVILIVKKEGESNIEIKGFKVKRSKNNIEINNDKIAKIKAKITDIDLEIDKDVDTSNDVAILSAIKDQLQTENPLLTNDDLSKITDNIVSLVPEVKTNVTLTITIDSESDTINIKVIKPLSDEKSINNVKENIEKIASKEITISNSSGSITENKNAILNSLRALSGYPVDLKGTTITIEEEETEITLAGVEFKIVITKGTKKAKISGFKVKRSENSVEINNDKIAKIKAKITDIDLEIDKDVDTSNDVAILSAIKDQLQVENPLLTNDDLSKITDNIVSLVPGVKTDVILTITIDSESDNINIKVIRPLNDEESINNVKENIEKITPKEIIISNSSGSITKNKDAIITSLKFLLNTQNIDLKGTTITIEEEETEITLAGVEFKIVITKGTKKAKISGFKVKRSENSVERNKRKINEIKAKITNIDLEIDKDVDTSNDVAILSAIKDQLQTENSTLTSDDLSKITDNIVSLVPGIKTDVILTITIDSESYTINIKVIRPLNDEESINNVKENIEKIVSKEITISNFLGSITENKDAILNSLRALSGYPTDLKGTTITIEEEETEITLAGVEFKIVITKGTKKAKISGFKVKRSENSVERNRRKINEIKAKITNIDLEIDKDVDTSNDVAILSAIKDQLQTENSTLTSDDLSKITDNIVSLAPGVKIDVILTITIDSESDTINIKLIRPLSDEESINNVKENIEKIVSKEITISNFVGSITKNKNAIITSLKFLLNTQNIDLKGTTITIEEEETLITPIGVEFKIVITKGTKKAKISGFKVKRSENSVERNRRKINEIKAKITDIDLEIDKDVDTSNDVAILSAIKDQLQTENSTLTSEDLSKITDNIVSLAPEVKTDVTLTITIDSESDTINIKVIRPLSDEESINNVKENIEKIASKEIKISNSSGSITENKNAILDSLRALSGYPVNLKGTTITIEEKETEITLSGVEFKIVITKGNKEAKISGFKVKRSKNNIEINNDKIAKIKAKITNIDLEIDKDVDTSNDVAILSAIKDQLQIENPILTSEDLSKIIDNIVSLVPGIKTDVTLTITIDSQSDTINIKVIRPLNDEESINNVKENIEKIASKEITISNFVGSITKNKDAILNSLRALSGYPANLKGTTITIEEEETEITLSGVEFKIVITKGTKKAKISGFIVKRSKNNIETNNDKIAKIKAKITDIDLEIDKDVDTSNDVAILSAIKNQLQIENPTLTSEDLSKITDNIVSLGLGVKTDVILTITIDSESDIINIKVIKSLSDEESVNNVKKAIEDLEIKEIKINAIEDSTIIQNKQVILDKLHLLFSASKIDLKGTTIEILGRGYNNPISSLIGVYLSFKIKKGLVEKEIIEKFGIKTIQNNDKINRIKEKIRNKNLIISKNVDTSNDAAILSAIKDQLKIDNPTLTNQDLEKITDNISSLTPGLKTNVTLTISLEGKTENFDIKVTKSTNHIQSIKSILENLSTKILEVYVNKKDKTINANKQEIIKSIENLFGFPKDLKGVVINIKNSNDNLVKRNDNDANIATPIIIVLSKSDETSDEIIGFKAKYFDSSMAKKDIDRIEKYLNEYKLRWENKFSFHISQLITNKFIDNINIFLDRMRLTIDDTIEEKRIANYIYNVKIKNNINFDQEIWINKRLEIPFIISKQGAQDLEITFWIDIFSGS